MQGTTNTEANRDGLQCETPAQVHTPTPWTLHSLTTITRAGKFCRIADVMEATDAAFIVRVCNAHDDLVAALKGLSAVIGKMKPATGEPYGQGVTELLEARAALAKAEGR